VSDSGTASADSFRSRFNLIAAAVIWLLCLIAAASSVIYGAADFAHLVPLAFVAFASWLVLWQPRVSVDDSAVRLINVTRTIEIPWPALIQIDTRYALTLRTPHALYSAAAAPAPGRLHVARGASDTQLPSRMKLDGPMRPGDAPTTDSGAAAWLVRDRWSRLSESGRIELGVAESTPVTVRWHTASLAVCGALLVLSVLALALS
jgi:hypothetical protein